MYWNFSQIAPPQPAVRFGAKSGRIVAEIGFGNGEFLQYLAKSKTDSLVVGIEISQWCVTKAARRSLALRADNIRLLHGDARYLLKYAFEPESISEVFMNFPCPWPKKRHEERRVTRGGFARLLWSRLEEGGAFNLATDVDWYAEAAGKAFSETGGFAASPPERNGLRDYVTKYERKWRAMGRDIYTLRALKTAISAEGEKIVEEGMPFIGEHEAEISRPLAGRDLRAAVAGLEGENIEGPGYIAVFRDVFAGERGDSLVKVISTDEGFEQHFYLRIRENSGKIKVSADAVGKPYHTPGVRAAIRHAAKRLSATHI
ncbi:MAG: tRNA (guanosine(46)-N7)-methyltransferase TrmB [Synergistaceae bacterium]|jgi:tRNA (guanine-N7-)-methyltransferase|nr:tRNA (guanosine(46)-N7)-methyltransferase TrmB [Synergistaceae bacterium]